MTIVDIYLLRAIGALGGAVIAVSIAPINGSFPIRRSIVSLASGLTLAPILRYYSGWPAEPDTIIAASCITSTLSWWAWHAATRSVASGWLFGFFRNGKADQTKP